jgi:hypothetical protein
MRFLVNRILGVTATVIAATARTVTQSSRRGSPRSIRVIGERQAASAPIY